MPSAGGASASPPIYEINGVEYVVYGFGDTTYVQGDAVIAFALPSAVAAAAGKKAAVPEKVGALAQRARVR